MTYDNTPATSLTMVDRIADRSRVLTRRPRHTPHPEPIRARLSPDAPPTLDDVAGTPWRAVELFPPATARVGSRFDETVAHPIDAPQTLDRLVSALTLRLRALPEVHVLGRRSLQYRAQIDSALRQARRAQARLADGSYGLCVTCTEPISLALLTEKPWTSSCVYCALDI